MHISHLNINSEVMEPHLNDAMQKHFGGLVSLVKDLKAKVETFDKILGINEKQEIQDILEKQRVINGLLLSNSESTN